MLFLGGNVMAIIASVLSEELERVQNHIVNYRKLLDELPKGSLVVQKIEGISYVYRKYKKNKKVISLCLTNITNITKQGWYFCYGKG